MLIYRKSPLPEETVLLCSDSQSYYVNAIFDLRKHTAEVTMAQTILYIVKSMNTTQNTNKTNIIGKLLHILHLTSFLSLLLY